MREEGPVSMLILEWESLGVMQDLVVTWMLRIDTWRAGGHSFSAYPPIVCGEGVLMELVPRSHPAARRESAAKPSV